MVTATKAPPALRQQFGDIVHEIVWVPEEQAALEARWHRARGLVMSGAVRGQVTGDRVAVEASGGKGTYQVDLSTEAARHGKGCECPDYHQRAPWGWCKHKLAAWIVSQLTDAQLRYISRSRQYVG